MDFDVASEPAMRVPFLDFDDGLRPPDSNVRQGRVSTAAFGAPGARAGVGVTVRGATGGLLMKAPKGQGRPILYLDFDGPLHHDACLWHPRRAA